MCVNCFRTIPAEPPKTRGRKSRANKETEEAALVITPLASSETQKLPLPSPSVSSTAASNVGNIYMSHNQSTQSRSNSVSPLQYNMPPYVWNLQSSQYFGYQGPQQQHMGLWNTWCSSNWNPSNSGNWNPSNYSNWNAPSYKYNFPTQTLNPSQNPYTFPPNENSGTNLPPS